MVVEYPIACSPELAVEREDSDNRGGGIGSEEFCSSYGGGSVIDGRSGSSKVTLLNLMLELFRLDPASRSLFVDSELRWEDGAVAGSDAADFSDSRSEVFDRHSRIVPDLFIGGSLVVAVVASVTSFVGEVVMIAGGAGGAIGWFVGSGGGFGSLARRPRAGSDAFRNRRRLNRGEGLDRTDAERLSGD